MVNFVIIVFCLLAGYLFKRKNLVPANSYKAINAWIIYIALPAMSFTYLPYLKWHSELLFAFAAPILVFFGSVLFFYVLSKFITISKRNRVTLSLISGLSNTSFVGFPLISAYYDPEFIEIGILCDQMTFFMLSSFGVWFAIKASSKKNEKVDRLKIFKNIISFPPLIGCLLAIALSRFVDLEPTKPFFHQLASTITPLALFSIGLQLNLNLGYQFKYISISILYILILAPLIALTASLLFKLKGDVVQISIFEMAMPSLVSTSMVLEKYKLNTGLGNSIIGLSILIGLVTTYFWYLIL
ncbi:AEC family transporter [Sphingobacterium hungaricum]